VRLWQGLSVLSLRWPDDRCERLRNVRSWAAVGLGAGLPWAGIRFLIVTDAVEKCRDVVGFAIGRRFRLIPGWTSELIGKPTTNLASLLRHRRTGSPCWRSDQTERHCLEVLHNGSEMKLVAGAGETEKAHALKAMLDLQVRKTHLYLLARIARSLELRRAL
jgi:hypothetical protein